MSDQLTFLPEEPRASHSASPDSGRDWMIRVATSRLPILRLLSSFAPRWLVWENVPGVLSSNGGWDFGAFLGALGKLGYGWAYRILDAQYYGVAQRRRRVFVVACAGDWRAAAAVLFESESLSGNPAPSREAGQGFAADVAPSLTSSGRGVERCGESRGQDPVIAQPVTMAHGQGNAEIRHGQGCSEDGTGRGVPTIAFAQNSRSEVRQVGGDGQITGTVASHHGVQQQTYVAQSMAVRRLTPRETERLQGFPDDHTLIPWRGKPAEQCPDGPRYKAIGNSWAVPVAHWLGERMEVVDQIISAETAS